MCPAPGIQEPLHATDSQCPPLPGSSTPRVSLTPYRHTRYPKIFVPGIHFPQPQDVGVENITKMGNIFPVLQPKLHGLTKIILQLNRSLVDYTNSLCK